MVLKMVLRGQLKMYVAHTLSYLHTPRCRISSHRERPTIASPSLRGHHMAHLDKNDWLLLTAWHR